MKSNMVKVCRWNDKSKSSFESRAAVRYQIIIIIIIIITRIFIQDNLSVLIKRTVIKRVLQLSHK